MEQQIAKIARDVLGLDTLETRKSDRLDFYDLAVWKIREALADAYLAGMNDSKRLVDRVARLNPAAGEIGAGMLASLVEDARKIQCPDHRPVLQHMGDGTPVEFCPECCRNEIVGRAPVDIDK